MHIVSVSGNVEFSRPTNSCRFDDGVGTDMALTAARRRRQPTFEEEQQLLGGRRT